MLYNFKNVLNLICTNVYSRNSDNVWSLYFLTCIISSWPFFPIICGLLMFSCIFSAIQMPSSQYYLEVVDSGIGTLDAATSIATAIELGETEVKLNDKSILVKLQLCFRPLALWILHLISVNLEMRKN